MMMIQIENTRPLQYLVPIFYWLSPPIAIAYEFRDNAMMPVISTSMQELYPKSVS